MVEKYRNYTQSKEMKQNNIKQQISQTKQNREHMQKKKDNKNT